MKETTEGQGRAFRFRPDLLKVLAAHWNKHIESQPYGIIAVCGLIGTFLCGQSGHHSEQLHLHEFAAYEVTRICKRIDLGLLVKQKPFHEKKQGDAVNDADSEDDRDYKPAHLRHSEFLGGDGGDESDGSIQEGADGDTTLHRIAKHKLNWEECMAKLRRVPEIDCASAPGRPREAHKQMKAFAATFGPLLEKSMPPVPQRKERFNTSWSYTDAAAFQRCVATEKRTFVSKTSWSSCACTGATTREWTRSASTSRSKTSCPVQGALRGS